MVNVYNEVGEVKRSLDLPQEIFGQPWSADLVHQVVVALEANKRSGLAKTKGRGEVRGGGKKPWRQKGTGRARASSIRSPLWRGGGKTHGPTGEKIYKKAINTKMKRKALAVVLSRKLADKEIVFVDKMPSTGKTKEAVSRLAALGKILGLDLMKKRTYLITPKKEEKLWRSLRNIPKVFFDDINNINPLKLLQNKFLIFVEPESILDALAKKYE